MRSSSRLKMGSGLLADPRLIHPMRRPQDVDSCRQIAFLCGGGLSSQALQVLQGRLVGVLSVVRQQTGSLFQSWLVNASLSIAALCHAEGLPGSENMAY